MGLLTAIWNRMDRYGAWIVLAVVVAIIVVAAMCVDSGGGNGAASPTATPARSCPTSGERAYFDRMEPLVLEVVEGAGLVRTQTRNIGNNPSVLFDSAWRDTIRRYEDQTRAAVSKIGAMNVPASLQDIHHHYSTGGERALEAVELFSAAVDGMDDAALLASLDRAEWAQVQVNEARAMERDFCR